MGRKIRGKKHRGVKDPYLQRLRRDESLKNKVNAPPSKLDEQEVPKSVLEIMKLKEIAKNATLKRKRRKKKKNADQPMRLSHVLQKEVRQPGMNKPDKPIPDLIQKPHETPRNFLFRVHRLAQDLIREAKYEEKFGVEIKKDPETGEVKVVKKQKDEFDIFIEKQKKANEKKTKKSKEGEADKPKKKTWSQKIKERKKKIKMLKHERKLKDFDNFKDEVKFGEVVQRPPEISELKHFKPATKSLLLSSVLEGSDKKMNIKRQSGVQQEKIEIQRKLAVEAYRKLKEMKSKPRNIT